jgi:acyl-CoA reductase-like NAD-dependent aldehyde dehydrogenase
VEAALQWIGGEWTGAHSGIEFESLAPDTGAVLGRWPRGGAADLERAVQAAEGAQAAWTRMGRAGRLRVAERALGALELAAARGELAEALAAPLAVSAELAGQLVWDELLRAREALELARDGGLEAHGTGVFALHWSDRAGLGFARLVARLVGGACVVLVADGRLPQAGLALARALESADPPAGALALLFDDGRTLRRAARGHGRLAFARECAAPRERLERGATGPREWLRVPLACATALVLAGDDPEAAALDVLDRALGPSRTLFGQFPGSVGRVLCERRVFARFSAALLGRIDADPRLGEPRAPVEEDLLESLQEAWSLGLDEGAAPLTGESPDPDTGFATPILFTNVDPHGRLIALDRPAPLLRLARADSDDQARALAQRLAPPSALPPTP